MIQIEVAGSEFAVHKSSKPIVILQEVGLGSRESKMKKFCEWCTRAKIVVVEVFSLAGLIVVLGFAIYFEWHHVAGLIR